MKKSILPLVLVWLALAHTAFATTVSLSDAQNVAVNFYKINVPAAPANLTASLQYTQTDASGIVDFYVFGTSPLKGFVIVAATDIVQPVIGFSSESNFDASAINNTGLKDWINTASGKISGAIQNNVQASTDATNQWNSYRQGIDPNPSRSASVAPLVATTWNQNPYYNADCPPAADASTSAQKSVTGCVATAMAQIMKFWSWPATGTGSYSYSDEVSNGYSKNYGTLSANFGATTYNWAAMPNNITAVNADIATLMYQAGVSVAMDYSPSGSGAWVLQSEAGAGNPCAQNSYVAYFGYASSIQGVSYSSYTSAAWITLLENELNAGRPVEYQGTDPSAGGHTWVCDGYNTSNQMHMNWGWGGVDNGYFAVSNLAVDGYTFSSDDAALIGIQPASAVSCGVPSGLTSGSITSSAALLSWTAVAGATSYNLQFKTSAASSWTTTSVSGTSEVLASLAAGTTYDYQVSAVCSSGSSAYSAASTFTTATSGSCGVPSGLASASITTTSATVSWTAVSGATSYNLEYKTSAATSWTTVSVSGVSKALTGLTAGTTYDFQVSTVCSSGTSAYSPQATFTTSSATLTYCTDHGNSGTYEWIHSVELGAINYTGSSVSGGYINTGLSTTLQIGSSSDTIYFSPGFTSGSYKEYWAVYIDFNKDGLFTDAGDEVVSGYTTGTGTFYATFSVPAGLASGTTRMRVVMDHTAISSSCGSFNRGEVADFNVNLSTVALLLGDGGSTSPSNAQPLSTLDGNDSEEGSMSLYPNPAQSTITIQSFSDSRGTAAISVYDLTGRKVIAEERQMNAGNNANDMDLSTLPTGIYMMEVVQDGQVNRQKFTVVK